MEEAVPVQGPGGWADFSALWNTLPPLNSSQTRSACTELLGHTSFPLKAPRAQGLAVSYILLCTPHIAKHSTLYTVIVTTSIG